MSENLKKQLEDTSENLKKQLEAASETLKSTIKIVTPELPKIDFPEVKVGDNIAHS